jgi:tripartite-type tricarboxylate transporter receptor subunit TctC
MIGSNRRSTACAVLALAGAIATASVVHAQSVADFYKGKHLTIYIGFGSGGGYDTSIRLFAPVFEKHIPGHPSVIVENMPGAGSMKVANYLYQIAPKDGSALGLFTSSTALQPLFGDKRAHYDPRKYAWIGSLTSDITGCGIWNGAGQGIKDLPGLIHAKKMVAFGATSPSGITSQHALFLKRMFNANIKVVYGYKGTHEVSLAMQRGEVNALCGMFESSLRSSFAQFVKSGEFKIFVQFGRDRKVPYFGDATQMYTMLKTAEDRKVADVIFRQTELARPLAAPPGTPKDRVAALRKAMLDTMRDPAMIATGKKIHVAWDPVSGAETDKLFAEFYATPPDLVKKAALMTQPDKK